jgi:predicted dehydrogenase
MTLPRRQFLTGLAPAALSAAGANDRIGVACVGVGTRGDELLRQVQAVAGTEVRVICDLYQGNIRRALAKCANPKVRVVPEWEKAVADRDVDAVVIATPDFWHAPMTIAAAQAKKDIYVEKGWCTSLEDAKRMRRAVKEGGVVMQLGHHYNGKPAYHRAREIYRSGKLGKISLVRTYTDRTSDFRFWKFYTTYQNSEMPKDAGPETIDWERFIANAPRRPFSAERFFTWRCWWDYGTGIASDLMSHLWDGVNIIMDVGIPEAVLTHGGIYFWKGDRDVPDQWNVVFDYPRQDLAVTFSCNQTNSHVGETTQLLGRDMTLEVTQHGMCRIYEAEWKPEVRARALKAGRQSEKPGALLPPVYSMREGELTVSSHMEDFFACVRSRQLPRCHVGRAFEEAVTILMSVESFRQERKVRWDPVKETIV